MKYQVTGAHRSTGHERTFVLDCSSAEEATARANGEGFLVSNVEPFDPERGISLPARPAGDDNVPEPSPSDVRQRSLRLGRSQPIATGVLLALLLVLVGWGVWRFLLVSPVVELEQQRAAQSAGDVQLSAKFVAVTEGKTGFKEGDRFYPVGMNAAEFIQQFGKPDLGIPEGYLFHYYGDGLLVNIDQDHRITRYVFYVVPQHNMQNFRAADVQTDKGVRAGDLYRHVVKAHGEPLTDERLPLRELRIRSLTYDWGALEFEDEQLTMIYVGRASN